MGVKVLGVSFNSELISGSTDYLLGNVLNKVTATIALKVEWIAYATEFNEITFNPTTGYSVPSHVIVSQLPVFQEFKNGDTILIQNTTSNNGTFTITEIIDNSTIKIGSALVNEVSITANIIGKTPITALNYDYNLIDNVVAPTYISAIDGSVQRFFAYGLDASDVVTVTNFEALGNKSWQNGEGAVVVGGGIDTYAQYFAIVHTFLVLPHYLDGTFENIQDGVKPSYFANDHSIKYITSIDAMYLKTDPNKKQSGTYVKEYGNVGWYDENFNTDKTNYSHTAIVHKRPDLVVIDSVEVTELLNTFSVDIINTVDTPFIDTTTKLIVGFALCSDAVDYKNALYTVEENFMIDRVLITVGNAAADGTYIENVEATFTDSGHITVTGNFKFDAADVTKLLALSGKNYVMWVDIQDTTLTISTMDRVSLLVDAMPLYIDVSNDGLITFDTDIIEINDFTDIGAIVAEFFPTDAAIFRSIIEYDYEADTTFSTITAQIIAENGSGDSFILDTFSQDISTQPMVSDVMEINFSQARSFLASGDATMNEIIFKNRHDLDGGGNYFYELNFPILFRWEYWKSLIGANAAFFDVAQQNNGLNQFWENYNANGFSIKYRAALSVVNDGNPLTFENKLTLTPFDYSSSADWTVKTLKAYDLDDNELTDGLVKYIQGYAKTKIVAVFTNVVAPDSSTCFVRFGAEVFEGGGVSNLHVCDSYYAVADGEWWDSSYNSGLVHKSVSSNTLTATMLLNNNKIPSSGNITIYARIYNGIPVGGKLTEAGVVKFTEAGVVKVVE